MCLTRESGQMRVHERGLCLVVVARAGAQETAVASEAMATLVLCDHLLRHRAQCGLANNP